MFTRLAFGVYVLLAACTAHAEPRPPFWENLTPGPHAVGFRTFTEFDAGRTWHETRDYLGRFTLAGPTGLSVSPNRDEVALREEVVFAEILGEALEGFSSVRLAIESLTPDPPQSPL